MQDTAKRRLSTKCQVDSGADWLPPNIDYVPVAISLRTTYCKAREVRIWEISTCVIVAECWPTPKEQKVK